METDGKSSMVFELFVLDSVNLNLPMDPGHQQTMATTNAAMAKRDRGNPTESPTIRGTEGVSVPLPGGVMLNEAMTGYCVSFRWSIDSETSFHAK